MCLLQCLSLLLHVDFILVAARRLSAACWHSLLLSLKVSSRRLGAATIMLGGRATPRYHACFKAGLLIYFEFMKQTLTYKALTPLILALTKCCYCTLITVNDAMCSGITAALMAMVHCCTLTATGTLALLAVALLLCLQSLCCACTQSFTGAVVMQVYWQLERWEDAWAGHVRVC